MKLEIETWLPVVGYEGIYSVSNFGNVISHDRNVKHYRGGYKVVLGRELSKIEDNHGYLNVRLSKFGEAKNKRIHALVAEAFLNHSVNRKFVIDHINNDKKNNKLSNLQIIKQQINNTKDRKRKGRFAGVSKCGENYRATSGINNKKVHIGLYPCELGAAYAYNKYIKENITY